MDMEKDILLSLAKLVLPKGLLESFVITGMEYVKNERYDEPELHIHLDESVPQKLCEKYHIESKGFMEAVKVTDFPIRDHKVVLVLRRRRWVDTRTGKSFSFPLKITAEGTRYSKEFAAFLKDALGEIPDNLPYT